MILTLILCQNALALNVCLYSRATHNPTSGHSFVTVEDDRYKVLESYGFWPKKFHASSLAINFPYDNPLRLIEEIWGTTARQKSMPESRICQKVRYSREQIREFILTYPQTYGLYRYFTNNCTHFAVRIYNALTGDAFPLVSTPAGAKAAIKKVYLSNTRSYREFKSTQR